MADPKNDPKAEAPTFSVRVSPAPSPAPQPPPAADPGYVDHPNTIDQGVSPEQAAFSSPDGGHAPVVIESPVKHIGGGVYELPDGEHVRGKEAADERVAELIEEEKPEPPKPPAPR